MRNLTRSKFIVKVYDSPVAVGLRIDVSRGLIMLGGYDSCRELGMIVARALRLRGSDVVQNRHEVTRWRMEWKTKAAYNIKNIMGCLTDTFEVIPVKNFRRLMA
jgi:hypothetical protein